MHFFFAPDIVPPHHVLDARESRHAVAVLRLGVGDTIHLVDGRGTLYEARVVKADPGGCAVRVVSHTPDYGRRSRRVVMAVAPTKNIDRFEWFLEKATEVGLDGVIPLECANSERRVFRADRASGVLVGAMKQSLKAYLPELRALTPVRDILTAPFDGVKLIAHCRADHPAPRISITEALVGCSVPHGAVAEAPIAASDALVLIGPEGDFTVDEIDLALAGGFVPVSLGPSRLRTETAALVAVTAAYLAR